jgi:hypothetical protein
MSGATLLHLLYPSDKHRWVQVDEEHHHMSVPPFHLQLPQNNEGIQFQLKQLPKKTEDSQFQVGQFGISGLIETHEIKVMQHHTILYQAPLMK